jgi:cytochrome c biogenesis protein
LNNEITEYPLVNILNNQGKVWLTWISNNKSLTEGIIAIVIILKDTVLFMMKQVNFRNVELNETVKFRQPITLLEIISSTGLQIKTDPYTSYLLGFFLLMLSTLISYITYSQIWIIQKNQKLLSVEPRIVLFLTLN